MAFHFMSSNGNQQLVVMDRNNGEPIKNAHVEVFISEYNRSERRSTLNKVYAGMTNNDGLYEINKLSENQRQNVQFKVSKGDDYLQIENQFAYLTHSYEKRKRKQIVWFTDRAIYRPGQIVHFKGVLLQFDEMNVPSIHKKDLFEIQLKDANHQVVETQSLKTCLLYTSPSPRDQRGSRMPSSA